MRLCPQESRHLKVPIRKELLLICALCIWGCAPGRLLPHRRDWRQVNIHKVVVVCMQGDPQIGRHLESNMVPKLRRQGFNAIATRELFSSDSKYSPRRMLELMQRAQVDGIMEINYAGENPTGSPRGQIKFIYHPIRGRTEKLSNRSSPLNAAFLELIAGTTR